MVTITDGKRTIAVTNGAFENTYKNLGFYKVGQKVEAAEDVKNDVKDTVEKEEKDDFAELLEKPISSWSKNELKTFASAKGIDTSSAKNVTEAKDIVKAWLEENE